MGLIAAKCTQCGANIKVDDAKEAGICEFCGTAFITEKAINNYKINTNKVVVNGENINISNYNIESNLEAINKFIKSGLYDDAKILLKQIIENCPYDYRGWWQMALLEYNQDGYWFDDNKNYQKALALADDSEIIKEYRDKEYDRILEAGQDIIDFFKNPNINMLDKIYISIGATYVLVDNIFSSEYLGLEIIDNQIKQVLYSENNKKYSRHVVGDVTLKAELSSCNSKIVGYFYNKYGNRIPSLYISDIINGEIVFSEIPTKYYNIGYIDHVEIIKGDTLINLQPSSSNTIKSLVHCICIITICVFLVIAIARLLWGI